MAIIRLISLCVLNVPHFYHSALIVVNRALHVIGLFYVAQREQNSLTGPLYKENYREEKRRANGTANEWTDGYFWVRIAKRPRVYVCHRRLKKKKECCSPNWKKPQRVQGTRAHDNDLIMYFLNLHSPVCPHSLQSRLSFELLITTSSFRSASANFVQLFLSYMKKKGTFKFFSHRL